MLEDRRSAQVSYAPAAWLLIGLVGGNGWLRIEHIVRFLHESANGTLRGSDRYDLWLRILHDFSPPFFFSFFSAEIKPLCFGVCVTSQIPFSGVLSHFEEWPQVALAIKARVQTGQAPAFQER